MTNREFEIDGTKYEFRFSWRAMKAFQNLTGKPIEKLANLGFDDFEKMIFCGLTGGKSTELTSDHVADFLDRDPTELNRFMKLFQHDIESAFGAPSKKKV